MEKQEKITCPNCGHEIDVQDVLIHQVEDKIQKKYNAKLAEESKKIENQAKQLEADKAAFDEQKQQEDELIREKVNEKLKVEEKQLEAKLKAKIEGDHADELSELQKELNEKSEKLKELNKSKALIEKLKREKNELSDEIEARKQKEYNQKLLEESDRIRKSEQEKNELAIKELEKKLQVQQELTKEMQRKHDQGSMQMQGEVMELAIEEWLTNNFPLDTIDEVKKGARGADCVQVVHTQIKQNCGSIYYESKRTNAFQPSWIEKFKNDIRDKGADIGVLVTDAMPAGMVRMGMRDGIWICTYNEFKALCFVLRETIIKVSNSIQSQENKGDKMVMLYDFLTSTEFRLQIEAIVEGFSQMKANLESEKRSMQRMWKQRDKQIEKVITNTVNMYGSIKGIAGNAIQPVKTLELPQVDFEDVEEPEL